MISIYVGMNKRNTLKKYCVVWCVCVMWCVCVCGVCTSLYVSVYVCVCICIGVYMCIICHFMCLWEWWNTGVDMYVGVYVCVYMDVCMCMCGYM